MQPIYSSFLCLVVTSCLLIKPAFSGYCNWGPLGTGDSSVCDLDAQGGEYCNAGQSECESGCDGRWCTNDAGYCNWGPLGTGDSSVCDGDVQGGEWCNVGPYNCESGCGGRWCFYDDGPSPTPPSPTPPSPTPPSPTPPSPTPPTGTPGVATTTRYWDCSGGACGCAYLPFGDASRPAHCHSNAMFNAPSNNPYGAKYYGTAAVSPVLFDPDNLGNTWLGEGCGKCWKLTGTANIVGYDTTTTTTIVLRGANVCPYGNPLCDVGPHFDIAAPGFDVTQFSFSNTCPEREQAEAEGFGSCEFWMINNQDPTTNCDCGKFNDPILQAGCNNFRSLSWDNAVVQYEEVPCPMELDRLSCWEENGNNYPIGIPEFCESNIGDPTSPTPDPTAPPTSKCSTFTGKNWCLNKGCAWDRDSGTCSAITPTAAPTSKCSTFMGKNWCLKKGCSWDSDTGVCSDATMTGPTAAPTSKCSTFTGKNRCLNKGCTWNGNSKECS